MDACYLRGCPVRGDVHLRTLFRPIGVHLTSFLEGSEIQRIREGPVVAFIVHDGLLQNIEVGVCSI